MSRRSASRRGLIPPSAILPAMDESNLIALLNSLSVGELESLQAKLQEAEQGCRELGHRELGDRLGEAGLALLKGDTRTFRKQVETVVSRLGHLR